MSKDTPKKPTQLELPFLAPKFPALRVIKGEGKKRPPEALASRNAVVRVLVEAGADLLLRRISSARAEEIEQGVEKVLALFDRVETTPALFPVLQRQLEGLEALMQETRALPARQRG